MRNTAQFIEYCRTEAQAAAFRQTGRVVSLDRITYVGDGKNGKIHIDGAPYPTWLAVMRGRISFEVVAEAEVELGCEPGELAADY